MSTAEITTDRQRAASAPAKAVYEAIQATNYAENGAPFDPLLIKFAAASSFFNGWNSRKGRTPISFFQAPTPAGAFRPLGDFVVLDHAEADRSPVMLLAPKPGRESMLISPVGFEKITDDSGSDNPVDLTYYWPTAPAGYTAMGIAVGFDGAVPSVDNYWCVKDTILQDASVVSYYSDAGSAWDADGSLNVPDLSVAPLRDKVLLTPTTFLSVYRSDGAGRALVLDKAVLPNASFPAPEPTFENSWDGAETDRGLTSVAVMPCTVVHDKSSTRGPKTNPFYYLAAEPFWHCYKGLQVIDGGYTEEEVTVGTSSTESHGFQDTTSLTVGAETGVEAGGFSAKVSVSYTHEMQVTAETTSSHDTEIRKLVHQDLPAHHKVYLWQARVDIVAYRTEGSLEDGPTVLSSAPFMKDDTMFTKKRTDAL